MIDHGRALELAASALDFPLPPSDAAALSGHLAICPSCAAAAHAMRVDAEGLASLDRRPAPAQVRAAVVRAAVTGRTSRRPDGRLRWSFAAAVLAILTVGGTFVAGALLERARDVGPMPTQVTGPQRTPAATARPAGWTDLGVVEDVFHGATVQLLLPTPDGGLVALGRDQRSTLPVVWTSDDGSAWTTHAQPEHLFSGRVPTGGALHDGRLWVVAWDIAPQGAQRAIWSSTDGVMWGQAGGSTGLLGTEANALGVTAGPAGLLVWAGDGRAWTSVDGTAWVRSDADVAGVVDGAVDGRFRLLAVEGGRATLVTSADGRTWGPPSRVPIAAGASAGIAATEDGALLAWVGDERYRVTQGGWARADGAARVPAGTVVAGPRGFAVIAAPTRDGTLQAWLGEGQGDWRRVRSEAATDGARTLVGAAPVADGWYVLTRQGTMYRGWLLRP